MEKTINKISNLKVGEKVVLIGTIAKKKAITKTNKPYITLCLQDNTGRIYSMIWSNSDLYQTIDKDFKDGDYCEVIGTVEKISSGTNAFSSMVLASIEKTEKPGTKNVVDVEALKDELREKINQINHPGVKELIINIFKREDVSNKFFTAPATEKSAYSFESALLAHTVRLIYLTDAVAFVFNNWTFNRDGFTTKLNIDLLKCCSIIHDIGKITAYEIESGKVIKTKEGELFQDSYLTAKIILEEIDKVALLPDEKMLLEHALTSSKDKLAYGALNVPRTREAIAFHLIERLDGQMANFEFMERTSLSSDEFVKLFEKTYFLGEFEA